MGLILLLVTVVLITLKIVGVLAWPWMMVLAPIWFPAAVMLTLSAIGFFR